MGSQTSGVLFMIGKLAIMDRLMAPRRGKINPAAGGLRQVKAAVTEALQGASIGTVPIQPALEERQSHGDQIRASDRNARRAAVQDRARRPPPRSGGSPAPQSQGRM